MNPAVGRGAMRQVINKDGLTLPGGHHLPQNAWVGVSVVDINRDDRYYVDPDQFQPFRFVRSKLASDTEGPPNDPYLATAEDKFMSFGYGRHSWYGIITSLTLSAHFHPPSLYFRSCIDTSV